MTRKNPVVGSSIGTERRSEQLDTEGCGMRCGGEQRPVLAGP